MTEQRKTQQQLSEEQLQAITGGCEKCVADLAKIAVHRGQAEGSRILANSTRLAGKTAEAATHETAAQKSSRAARALQQKVNARHPASSSTSGQ